MATNSDLKECADENVVRLTGTGIDLNDLRDPKGDGAMFEIAEEEAAPCGECNERTYFEKDSLQYLSLASQGVQDSDEESDEDDTASPFERLVRTMEDLSLEKDGGVMKKILSKGTGDTPPPGARVTIHYNQYLEYADEPNDSTRLRKMPITAKLGCGEMLVGLDVAVQSMRKNELARIILAPKYAYGELGCKPRIPEKATLMFEVELIKFVDQAGVDEFYSCTRKERKEIDFKIVKRAAEVKKSEGSELFKEGKYRPASFRYDKAIQALEEARLKDEDDEKEQQRILLKLYLNISLCSVHPCESGRALTWTAKALEIDSKNPKALYLRGRAFKQQGQFKRAFKEFSRAQAIKPNDKDINRELRDLEVKEKQFKATEKVMCQKMFARRGGGDATAVTQTEKPLVIEDEIEDEMSEIRNTFKGLLSKFLEDPEQVELPFPKDTFSEAELECIGEISKDLKLKILEKGEGDNSHILFVKTPSVE